MLKRITPAERAIITPLFARLPADLQREFTLKGVASPLLVIDAPLHSKKDK